VSFDALPDTAAWTHHQARTGFEVVYFHLLEGGYRIEGCTTAVEDGQTWIVDYEIRLDEAWRSRRARVTGRSASGARSTTLETDGAGRCQVDGVPTPHLDGCFDVDLESSALTNALPVHRIGLAVGERADAPAAYVRALDLRVERLEQTYMRTADLRYDYAAPAFDFACELVYDRSGLVLEYPGIAVRAGSAGRE
jgi:hypothetical protein